MEKHNLEEYFNRRVSKYSEFIDKDELWDNLGLEKKKDRKIFFWIWGSLLLILLLVGGMLLTNWNGQENLAEVGVYNEETIISNSDQVETNLGIYAYNEPNLKEENKNDNLPIQVSNSQEFDLNPKLNRTQKYTQSEKSEVLIAKTESKNKIDLLKTDNTFRTENNVISKYSEKTFTGKNAIRRQRDLIAKSLVENSDEIEISVPLKSNNKAKSLLIPLNENEQALQVESPILKRNENVRGEIKDGAIIISQSDIEEENELLKVNKNQTSNNAIVNSELFLERKENDIQDESTANEITLGDVSRASPWMIGLYVDVAKVDRNLTSLSPRFDSLVGIRNASEKTLERIGFGAYMKYQASSGFYAKFGINYTSLNTEMKARILSDEIESKDDFPLTIILKEDGDTIGSNFGTLIERTVIEQQLTIYTSHKIIDIPFTFGYQYFVGKWSLFAELQPSISILHSYRGQIFDGRELISDNVYVDTSTKFSFASAIGVSYKLNEKWRLWAQPYYQVSFNSYMTQNSGQNEKYNFYGLKIGTEIQF